MDETKSPAPEYRVMRRDRLEGEDEWSEWYHHKGHNRDYGSPYRTIGGTRQVAGKLKSFRRPICSGAWKDGRFHQEITGYREFEVKVEVRNGCTCWEELDGFFS